SAGTMTAIASGVKTRIGHVGVGPGAAHADCAGAGASTLLTLLELAESAGMATGIVTSTRLTHATPAAMYAHVPARGWESDGDLPEAAQAERFPNVATQLVRTQVSHGPEIPPARCWPQSLPPSIP